MKIPKRGKYHCHNSDLLIEILAIYHRSEKGYIKAKYNLTNKKNGIFYEKKTRKIWLKNIQHWERWL